MKGSCKPTAHTLLHRVCITYCLYTSLHTVSNLILYGLVTDLVVSTPAAVGLTWNRALKYML